MTAKRRTKKISPRDQKKRIAALAVKIYAHSVLSAKEASWLANALSEIAQGKDANEALGIKYARGQSEADEEARMRLSMIMHWIAGAIDKKEGLGLSLEDAFEKAQIILAASLSRNNYDAEYLKKAWYHHKHMQGALRTEFDPDSPF